MLDERQVNAWLDEMLAVVGVPPQDSTEEQEGSREPSQPYPVRTMRDNDTFEAKADLLRVLFKYLLFDLEATRRENLSLRKIFEQRSEES